MKTPILAAVLGASLLALPVAAQTTTAPAPTGAAAATLPNAFEEAPAAAPARRPAPPPAPTSVAPDIARSETALRAAIASLTSDPIDYSAFSEDLATQIRGKAEEITPLIRQFGPLRTVEHRGQQDGADLFRVVFEKQATDWVIAFNDEDQIAALLFRPGSGD
ncbi:hypothetical protein D3C71_307400 [compost metagenome]